MKTVHVSLCSWDFEFGDENILRRRIDSYGPAKRKRIVNARLAFLMKALEVFKKHKMLIVERMKVYIFDKEFDIDVSNLGYEGLFEKLHKDLQEVPKDAKSFFSCDCLGITEVIMGDTILNLENVIKISYFISGNNLSIGNYSDLWIPIGLDDNYQIDLALANAPRLRKCLEEIKEIGTYRCIFPDVDEPGMGTIPQRGFHMFVIECDVTDRADFPWDRYEEIKGFLLKCY